MGYRRAIRADTGAVRAFTRYAELGFEKRRLSEFEIYDAIRGCCPDEGYALDMLAVYDTLRLLTLSGRGECARAVRGVYFALRGRRPRKNDISSMVLRHAYENSYDPRTVYRQLQRAKETFYFLRGRNK